MSVIVRAFAAWPADVAVVDLPRAVSTSRALVAVSSRARSGRLILRHPVFSSFKSAFFRISEAERKPVLVIPMDDREASLLVDSMMREFCISRSDEDGIMLGLVGCALEFVTGLRVGDWLPSEILTGEASWAADEIFQERALARLNLCLLAWMAGGTSSVAREVLSHVGQAAMSAEGLTAGLQLMVSKVGGITLDEALIRLRQVADEFAYVESLRDRLLHGAVRMVMVLDRLARTFRGDATHRELLGQIRRLASIGVADLQARFDQADLAVADVEKVVVDPGEVVLALRSHRDGLYVRCRAWDPYIVEWDTIQVGQNARTWQLAHETYRFLAPRFMTIVEWRSVREPLAVAGEGRSRMAW